MQLLDVHQNVNIFLLVGSTNKQIVTNISRHFENNPERFKRIVICSRSPTVIYQVIRRVDKNLFTNETYPILFSISIATKAESAIYLRSLARQSHENRLTIDTSEFSIIFIHLWAAVSKYCCCVNGHQRGVHQQTRFQCVSFLRILKDKFCVNSM